jgi:hypothetical protein
VGKGKPIINSVLEKYGRNYNGILQNTFLTGLTKKYDHFGSSCTQPIQPAMKMDTTNIFSSLPIPSKLFL